MVLQIPARLKSGVLIPSVPINLPNQEDLILTIVEPVATTDSAVIRDDPRDPCPNEGLPLLEWFGRHRVDLDPNILRDIIESDEFLDQESNDEP